MENFAIVASSTLFLFFWNLAWYRNNNLSLGFKVGKFRDRGPLDFVNEFYSSISISNKTNNLSTGFKVGKFRDSGPLDIIYGFYFFWF